MAPRVAGALLIAAVVGLAACAPRKLGPPPPPGPFRTVTGDPTHPVCGAPGRAGADGSEPRCVVPLVRSPTAMAVSPDGRLLIASLMDVEPTVWRLPDLGFVYECAPVPAEPDADEHGEREAPQAIVVAPDSRTALFAAGDRLIRYDLADGHVLGALEGPGGMIDAVAWSHDGRRLLVATASDGRARVLDAADGRLLRTFPGTHRVVKLALAADGRRAALGTDVGTVEIVDLQATGKKARVFTPSTQEIVGLGFVDDRLVIAARDGRLRVVDPGTGAVRTQVDVGAPVTRFALSGDGRLVATADERHVVRVHTLVDGTLRHTFAWHRASISALAWGAGGALVVFDNDGELAAWDLGPR